MREAWEPCEVLDASDAVEPSMEPLAEPGDCALLSGVEGREILAPRVRAALAPAGAGAAERTISMKSWICNDKESSEGCDGTFFEMRLFVYLGAEGDTSPDLGCRLLKKDSSEVDPAADGGMERVQSSKDVEGCKVVVEDLLEDMLLASRTDGNWKLHRSIAAWIEPCLTSRLISAGRYPHVSYAVHPLL
jgi:hypothetical protein